MKKWIILLIGLGYLNPAFATQHESFLVTGEDLQEVSYFDRLLETPNFFNRVYPSNLNPNAVIVPRHNSGFMFGLTGYRQSPYDNQLDFAINDPTPGLYLPSLNSHIQSVDPDDEFAYGGYIGYIYPYTGRDIRLDLYNMSGHSKETASGGDEGFLWAPLGLYDRTVTAIDASTTYSTSVEQAQLMVGQQLHPGSRFRVRPSLGVKYAGISRDLTTSYFAATDLLADFSFGNSFVHEKSKFNGAGPAVQLDGSYFFTPRFGLVGHITNAVLIGGIQSEVRYTEQFDIPELIDPDHFFPANTAIVLKSTNRAVPNIDAKLGFLFEHLFCGSLVKLNVELGYEFNHFFNAVDTYRSAGGVVHAGAIDVEGTDVYTITPLHVKHVHDFTLDGPYLSIGLSGISCPNDAVIDPVCVTVPRLEGGFVFAIGAGYFRIEGNQRDFALLDAEPTIITAPGVFPPLVVPGQNSTLQNVEADEAYGLLVNLGYIFKHSPYDINVHYEGAQTQDNDRVIAPATHVIWPILSIPFFNTYESRISAREATANLQMKYYEIHADVGQSINADSLIGLRLFEGAEYVNIKSDYHVIYHDLGTVPGFGLEDFAPLFFPREDVVQKSRFTGYGPRFGFDMNLPMGGFSLLSQLAGGFLVGNIDASYHDTYSIGTTPIVPGGPDALVLPEGELGTQVDSASQFSPYVDLKVALAFGWNMFSAMHWTVELGYKAAHYYNAMTSFRHATNNAAIFVKQVGDITVDGPYLNIAVFGFGACPPDCIVREPYCAFVPMLRGGWEFAVEGLYLQPHASNIDYGILDPHPVLVPDLPIFPPAASGLDLNPSVHSKVQVIDVGSNHGYRAHIGYIFPLTANDVSVNYATLNADANKTSVAPVTGVIWTITNGSFGAQSEIAPTLFPVLAGTAQANVDFEWQTGNVELGRRVKFYNLMTRFFAGLTYAKVNETIGITYLDGFANNDDVTFIASDTVTQNNDFSGFGPRLGLAGDLALECGFSLIGQAGTDLLIGRINSDFVEVSSSGDATALNPVKRTRLVPALDAKLGIAYTVGLVNCAQFSFELGYQVNHYFNAKDSLRFTDYASTFIKQDQDLSFDGPYARIQFSL